MARLSFETNEDSHESVFSESSSKVCGDRDDDVNSDRANSSAESSEKANVGGLRKLLFGQGLSMTLAGTGICSALLSDKCFKAPTFQNLGNYVVLMMLFFPLNRFCANAALGGGKSGMREERERILDDGGDLSDADKDVEQLRRSNKTMQVASTSPTRKSFSFESMRTWWPFAVLALIDIEANYLVVLAFEYTSVTSVMLLDCFTIPCVIILSYFFLKYTYNRAHIVGAIICGIGMMLIVLSDFLAEDEDGGSSNSCDDDGSSNNAVLGDFIALSGAVLYAVSNVVQESLIKSRGPCEYLGRLGMFGSLFAAVQVALIERSRIADIDWADTTEVVLPFVGYVSLLLLAYVATSFFLKDSDAALFNLSLLTSDVYTMLFAYVSGRQSVQWLYLLAFVATSIGLVIYHFVGGPVARDPTNPSRCPSICQLNTSQLLRRYVRV
eukprot:g1321.t1